MQARQTTVFVLALAATLTLVGCRNPDELAARPVPRNLCAVVGESILDQLAPGGRPSAQVRRNSDDVKSIACVAATYEDDPDEHREKVSLAVTVTRFGADPDVLLPYEAAEEYLVAERGRADKRSGDAAGTVADLDYDGYRGYVATTPAGDGSASDGAVPQIELAVRKDDTVLRMQYEPVAGVPAETAKRWLISAGERLLDRFSDVGYGH